MWMSSSIKVSRTRCIIKEGYTFPRQKTVVGSIDQQWQADLADMIKVSSSNDGYRYLLTVIDCFSKYAWVIPIKKKDSPNMFEAIKVLFDKSRPRKHKL